MFSVGLQIAGFEKTVPVQDKIKEKRKDKSINSRLCQNKPFVHIPECTFLGASLTQLKV